MIHLIVLTLKETGEKCAFVIENIHRIYIDKIYDSYRTCTNVNCIDGIIVKESVEEITKRINQIVYGTEK